MDNSDQQRFQFIADTFLLELKMERIEVLVQDHPFFATNPGAVYCELPNMYISPKWRDRTSIALIMGEIKAAMEQTKQKKQLPKSQVVELVFYEQGSDSIVGHRILDSTQRKIVIDLPSNCKAVYDGMGVKEVIVSIEITGKSKAELEDEFKGTYNQW